MKPGTHPKLKVMPTSMYNLTVSLDFSETRACPRTLHTHSLSNVTSQYSSVLHIASPKREGCRRLDHGCHFLAMTYVKTLYGGKLSSGSA